MTSWTGRAGTGPPQGSSLLHHRPAEGAGRQRWETRLCGAEERCRQHHPAGGQRGALCTGADGRRVNWISGTAPTEPVAVTAKTRYSQTEAEAEVTPLPEGRMRVVFRQPQRAITSGQAVVLYDGDTVLGGGVIEDR